MLRPAEPPSDASLRVCGDCRLVNEEKWCTACGGLTLPLPSAQRQPLYGYPPEPRPLPSSGPLVLPNT